MVSHMIQQGYLDTDNGLIRVGPETEREFGRGHYRDLLASFSGAQLLTGRCGSAEVGYIDPTALTGEDPQRLLLLAGRSWLVKEIEWAKKVVWLEPAKEGGKARWMGGARSLSREVCQGILELHWLEASRQWRIFRSVGGLNLQVCVKNWLCLLMLTLCPEPRVA